MKWKDLGGVYYPGSQLGGSEGRESSPVTWPATQSSSGLQPEQDRQPLFSPHPPLFRGGSKITADGDCSHEIKRHLLLGRKVITHLDSILKSRDITLPTKVYLVKAMVFLVVMYGCESWTIKKAEHQRIDAFELWYWRKLKSPLECKEIQPVHPIGNQS